MTLRIETVVTKEVTPGDFRNACWPGMTGALDKAEPKFKIGQVVRVLSESEMAGRSPPEDEPPVYGVVTGVTFEGIYRDIKSNTYTGDPVFGYAVKFPGSPQDGCECVENRLRPYDQERAGK